jgi:predicted transcriptional regulator YheO
MVEDHVLKRTDNESVANYTPSVNETCTLACHFIEIVLHQLSPELEPAKSHSSQHGTMT